MDDLQRVMESAAAGGVGSRLAAALADKVGNRAGVQAIFGEPVERDGVTVIPVGRLRWGFGGGGGTGGPPGGEPGEGAGGGGGATVSPVGYIEISGGTATFRRVALSASPGALLAAAIAILLVLRGVRGLFR